MKFIRYFFVLLFTVVLNAIALAKTPKVLKVAVYDFPPHLFAGTKSPVPRGPGLDFLHLYVAPAEDYQVQLVSAPFARVLQDLEHQKVDVALFLADTPAREKLMKFSKTALFTTASGVIVVKDSPLSKASGLHDFTGKTLGHSMNSVIPDFVTQNGIKIEALSGENVIFRNIEKMRSGRLDGIFVPTVSNGQYLLKKYSADKDLTIYTIPGSSLNLHLAFRKDIDAEIFEDIEKRLSAHKKRYQEMLKESVDSAQSSQSKQ